VPVDGKIKFSEGPKKFLSNKGLNQKEETKSEQEILREQKERDVEEKLRKQKEEDNAKRSKFENSKLERPEKFHSSAHKHENQTAPIESDKPTPVAELKKSEKIEEPKQNSQDSKKILKSPTIKRPIQNSPIKIGLMVESLKNLRKRCKKSLLFLYFMTIGCFKLITL